MIPGFCCFPSIASLNTMSIFAEVVVRLFNLIAPRRCVMCGCRLAIGENVICSGCNLDLPRTFFSERPYDNDLTQMFWGRLPIKRAAALFFYKRRSLTSRIIYSMKYLGHPEAGELMGQVAAKEFAANGFFDGIDIIVPIPLSRLRQLSRGYNQSMEIAKGISDITKIPIADKAVKRLWFRSSQTHLNFWQRMENVEKEFRLKDGSRIKGRHVLIVDDIVTTGATVYSCAKELMKSGDVTFSILSLGFTQQD